MQFDVYYDKELSLMFNCALISIRKYDLVTPVTFFLEF